jgi:CRISPR-associated protein Csx10
MVELSLTLEALSPLSLHRDRASAQFTPTLDYIPGSTLRGALAGRCLQGDAARAQDADFRALFLDDQVLYPDLLPASNAGAPWRLAPSTAWACKRYSAEHKESVTDMLLRLALAEAQRRQGGINWLAPQRAVEDCPTCEALYGAPRENRPRDRLGMVYAATLDPTFVARKVNLRLLTGTAVDRATGAVASGLLFSQEVVDKGNYFFTGNLRLADTEAPRMQELLTERLAPLGTHLYLGHGRSRGLGHVKIWDWQLASTPTPSLEERWKNFNQTARKLWKRYGADPLPGPCFSLTLLSHLALRDDGGQPVLDQIKPAHLGLPWVADWGWCSLAAVAIPGWNVAWGLPKADTWALRRGSVLFGCVAPQDEAATLARLAELEAHGAGDRRGEGLGRLRACDEFHYVYTDKEPR